MDNLLKKQLATTTALVVALFGYSRRAYSACVISSGTSYLCSGTDTSTLTILDNEANVSTAPGFSVNVSSGNAITITGDGALSFTDTNASTIATTVSGIQNAGLNIISNADDGGTLSSVTVNANSNFTGGPYGISTYNNGSGATAITVNGHVTGEVGGIYAENGATSTGDLSITTGGNSIVTGNGQYGGISVRNHGTGATTITVGGDVTGNGASAGISVNGTGATTIIVNGHVASTNSYGILVTSVADISITTAAYSLVTGAIAGIVTDTAAAATTITVNGDITSGALTGLYLTHPYSIYAVTTGAATNLSITTGASSVIMSGGGGIRALNNGIGATTLAIDGSVTGAAANGIYATNAASATDLAITTRSGKSITGGTNGISVVDAGTGSLTITNPGTISGNTGILVAGNGGAAGSITNENTGTIEGTGGTAISLTGLTAVLPITINGGHIIGDITDDTPSNGFSPITVAHNFTSDGNFNVSGFNVASGATFTLGTGNTITSFNTVNDSGTMTVAAAGSSITGGLSIASGGILNASANFGVIGALANNGTVNISTGSTVTVGSTSTGTGTLDFEVKAGSTTTNGMTGLLASNAAVDLTGTSLKVNVDPTSGFLQNNSRFEVITGAGAATTPVVTATATPVLMTASDTLTYKFYYTTGAYAGSSYGGPIGGSNADVYVIAVQNNIAPLPTITANDVSAYNAFTASAASSPSFNTIAGILNSAPTAVALHTDLQALAPTVDGGTQISALNVVALAQGINNNRLMALREGDTTSGVAAGATVNGFSMWTEGYGQHARQDMMDGVSGYSSNTWGGAVGFDSSVLLDNAIVGVALNYGHSAVNSENANTTTTNLGNYGLNIYGTYDLGQRTFVNGQAGYAYNAITSDRHNADLAGATAEGKTNSHQYSVKLDLGHDYTVGSVDLPDDWQIDPMTLTPDISAAYTYLSTQGYTETGAGVADQIIGGNSKNMLDVGIGGTVSWKIKDDSGNTVKPALHAGYSYDAVGDKLQTVSSFAGNPGASFITNGASLVRSTFDAGANLVYTTAANWDFSATYSFQIKQDYTAHTGELRVTAHF